MFKFFDKDKAEKERQDKRKSQAPSLANSSRVKLEPCNSVDDFQVDRILGTGSFGRVNLAIHKKTGAVCALKCLSKSQVLKTKQVMHIKAEKAILELINFPFIVPLFGTFQDKDTIYLVLEYVVGGEFFTHLRNAGRFTEETSKFYAAQIVLTFEFLHSKDIIYRDLKPENLLLDKNGNCKITDFGFAKIIDHRTYTLCGTPDYLAPEIILNKGHGKPVDWWALGVLIYEMIAGYPPFYDDDPMGTYQKILHGKIEYPSHFSRNARDLIRKLLYADLTKRYGNLKAGPRDIKNHPWFSGIDWKAVVQKDLFAPIQPEFEGDDDTSNFDDYSDVGAIDHQFNLTNDEQALFSAF